MTVLSAAPRAHGPTLSRHGTVFVLDLGAGENRFTPRYLTRLQECLKEVESSPAPRSLVTTATGKFFSTGLDLQWISETPDQARPLVDRFQRVLASIVTCSAYTVAAVQGHAFGGGAMLALAHDITVMRADRGYFCLPEIDLPLALTNGMHALLASEMTVPVAAEALLTGRRYTADEAMRHGFVHYAAEPDDVLPSALELAGEHSDKDPKTLTTIKERLYRDVVEPLRSLQSDLPEAFPPYRGT